MALGGFMGSGTVWGLSGRFRGFRGSRTVWGL